MRTDRHYQLGTYRKKIKCLLLGCRSFGQPIGANNEWCSRCGNYLNKKGIDYINKSGKKVVIIFDEYKQTWLTDHLKDNFTDTPKHTKNLYIEDQVL